jgi:ubiquinone/menaquinone biosynthesis C-methylase UbiE
MSQLSSDSKLIYSLTTEEKKELLRIYLKDNNLKYVNMCRQIKNQSDIENITALKNVFPTSNNYDSSKHIADSIKKLLDPINHVPVSYLDIGASDGKKTNAIAALYNLDKEHAHGADNISWEGVDIKISPRVSRCITYTQLKESDNEILPYEDNQFDTITLLQVLHHVKNLPVFLNEVDRILAPGGAIVIREHDAINRHVKSIIDVEHLLFAALNDNSDVSTFINEYYADYKSRMAWNSVFSTMGYSEEAYYDTERVSKRYYAVHKKQ